MAPLEPEAQPEPLSLGVELDENTVVLRFVWCGWWPLPLLPSFFTPLGISASALYALKNFALIGWQRIWKFDNFKNRIFFIY